ncbi:phage major tail protein, TP901-1 family [Staphylococcus chromogenes]|uniref:phage major tail protein, TP901-1 family n=1 Tax=Staphylococcus chromogenes TaxID=46126 RepID=UPI003D7AB845
MQNSNDTLLLFRICGAKVDATKLMFATEFSVSHERKADSEGTMDGSYTTSGAAETTFSYTAKMATKDKLSEEVEDALLDGTAYEAWVIDSKYKGDSDNSSKYRARYIQGHFSKFELKGEADGVNEYEVEIAAGGRMQRGFATLPKTVEGKLAAVGYKFHDTVASDPATDGLAVGNNIPQPTASGLGDHLEETHNEDGHTDLESPTV